MNRKTLIIDTCSDCPNFDNEYPDWDGRCFELDRQIPMGCVHNSHLIPDDCPLKDVPEEPVLRPDLEFVCTLPETEGSNKLWEMVQSDSHIIVAHPGQPPIFISKETGKVVDMEL